MGNKVLFVHDGPLFVSKEGREFFGNQINDNLIDRYRSLGKTVTFLMRSRVIADSEQDNYSLIRHPDFRYINIPHFQSLKSYHTIKKAKSIIHKAINKHDVIIVRLPSAAGVIAFKEAKKQNKPMLIEFVACVYDSLWNYDWRGKILAKYKFIVLRNLMKNASHTIYVTDAFLQSRYPSQGKSIGCSDVELQCLDDEFLLSRLENIKIKQPPFKLATVAAIDVIYKGQADVIRAIAALKQREIYFKYDIIGQGNPERLQNLIDKLKLNDQVTIIGSLPHDQVFKELIDIDLYIQPSKTEGLPRAVIEAMSMGCSVAGSNVGGIPELLNPDCLFQPGSIEEIADTIISFTPEKLKIEAKRNFKFAKQYQIDTLKQKRDDFYKTFLRDFKLNE